MSGINRLRRKALLAAWVFTFVTSLIIYAPGAALAQAAADEAALRMLTERFFDAYQKEDIKNLLALWSEGSPERTAFEQSTRRTFAENEKIQLNSLSVLALKVEGDRAASRVLVDVSAVETKTGRAAAGFGKMSRAMRFVREASGWKIWRYVSGEVELSGELLNARTEEERRSLLASRPELDERAQQLRVSEGLSGRSA